VHDPEKPAIPPTLDPQPLGNPPTPPESSVRQRKRYEEDESEDEEMSRVTERRRSRKEQPKQQEQAIPGVPNEMLLPGALVVLGAVVVITFAIGRATSR
ncbi:hypothetical protein KC315_g2831, partial [Hortaea werneckii]